MSKICKASGIASKVMGKLPKHQQTTAKCKQVLEAFVLIYLLLSEMCLESLSWFKEQNVCWGRWNGKEDPLPPDYYKSVNDGPSRQKWRKRNNSSLFRISLCVYLYNTEQNKQQHSNRSFPPAKHDGFWDEIHWERETYPKTVQNPDLNLALAYNKGALSSEPWHLAREKWGCIDLLTFSLISAYESERNGSRTLSQHSSIALFLVLLK